MAYAAPEQIQEGQIDARIDIYSLAIVLYELLTGRLPFMGETSFDFLMARLTEPPLPVQEANPNVPAVFVPILDKALVQDPNARYQTMPEFSQALIEAREQLGRHRYRSITYEPTSVMNTQQLKETKVSLKLTASGQQISPSNQSELIVGRAHKNTAPDIDLEPYGGTKAGVSRRHGRLVRKDNLWFVEDMGSTNGTFVNNTRLAPNTLTALQKGDKIRFGQIELEFSLE
jgi:serine/threonine protein kinase